jgi:predicted transcriptional regulator
LTEKKKDWWDDLTEAQKADIAQGELEFERGEYISYEDMMKKYR